MRQVSEILRLEVVILPQEKVGIWYQVTSLMIEFLHSLISEIKLKGNRFKHLFLNL